MNILLFGAPGSGKGTQSALLVDRFNMAHISTGDLFRAAIKQKTPLGLEAKGYIDQGQLVPDSVTIGMVAEALRGLKGRPFILDGFPRNVAQAEALGHLLSELRLSLDKALFLEVSTNELVKRLSGRRVCRKCGAVYHVAFKPLKNGKNCDNCGDTDVYQREDDKEEAVGTRLKVYAEYTQPLKGYYNSAGKLVELDGTGATDEVFKRIEGVVKN